MPQPGGSPLHKAEAAGGRGKWSSACGSARPARAPPQVPAAARPAVAPAHRCARRGAARVGRTPTGASAGGEASEPPTPFILVLPVRRKKTKRQPAVQVPARWSRPRSVQPSRSRSKFPQLPAGLGLTLPPRRPLPSPAASPGPTALRPARRPKPAPHGTSARRLPSQPAPQAPLSRHATRTTSASPPAAAAALPPPPPGSPPRDPQPQPGTRAQRRPASPDTSPPPASRFLSAGRGPRPRPPPAIARPSPCP